MMRTNDDLDFTSIDGVSISFPRYLSADDKAAYFAQIKDDIANNPDIQDRLQRIREQNDALNARRSSLRIQAAIELLEHEGYTVTPA